VAGRASQTTLIGAAGEYYVAAELSKDGWLATVTIKNSPGLDVLAVEPPPGQGSVSIQVKTTTKSSWVLPRPAAEVERRPNEFFILVRMPHGAERPDYYVLPADLALRITRWHGAEFLKRHGRAPSMITVSRAWIADFREAWHLLRDPSDAEALMDDRYRAK
jgi:hypothetical protein